MSRTNARRESPERLKLRHDLDALARRGRALLLRRRLSAALPPALDQAMPLLLIAPCGFLAFRIVLLLSAPGSEVGAPFVLILCLLLPYVLAVAAPLVAILLRRPGRSEAIAQVDRALGLRDRLLAADEFLGEEPGNSFMEAAIDDASRHTGAALQAPLPRQEHAPHAASRRWLFALAGMAVLGLAFLIDGEPSGRGPLGRTRGDEAARSPAPEPILATPSSSDSTRPPVEDAPRPETETASRPVDRPVKDPGMDLGQAMKKAEGKTKSGETADAGAPTGGTQAKGQPTDQGQPAKGLEKPKPPRATKPLQPRAVPETPKKTVKDQSGATAGRGASGGSNKNPVASEWTSRDQPPPGEEDPKDEDEELDDENESDESRGGLQPSLRDRKPPTSRDLGMGMGSRPGGEGRGGPSEPKKSRGVASLVLGVPVPDHVKGQVNKGTTKITQERVEPRAEDAAAAQAAARASRALPAASRDLRALPLWLRALSKKYFLDRRNTETKTP